MYQFTISPVVVLKNGNELPLVHSTTPMGKSNAKNSVLGQMPKIRFEFNTRFMRAFVLCDNISPLT